MVMEMKKYIDRDGVISYIIKRLGVADESNLLPSEADIVRFIREYPDELTMKRRKDGEEHGRL